MKSVSMVLGALAALVASSNVFAAGTIDLQTGAYAVASNSDVELISVHTLYSGREKKAATYATLSIGMSGCLNELGPVGIKIIAGAKGKYTIAVSATEILMEASKTVRCAKQERKDYEVAIVPAAITQDKVSILVLE